MFRRNSKTKMEEPGTPPEGPAGASSAREDSGPDVRDAFAPENFNMVLLIMLMRLYDINLAILAIDSPKKAQQLAEMHEKGLTFTPHPAYSIGEDE